MFKCPVCQHTLNNEKSRFACDQAHAFDKAKEGYVNLLLVQHKKSLNPGDEKGMVYSRRDFLSKGFYNPLVAALQQRLSHTTANQKQLSMLDIGCGEGYYLRELTQQIRKAETSGNITAIGLDISKPAIQQAAKQDNSDTQYIVASSHDLPLENQTVDLALNIFAPLDIQEALRVLRPGGFLVKIVPGPKHLFGLKQLIYQTPCYHDADEAVPMGFSVESCELVSSQLALDNATDIKNLLAMTPYYWNINQQTALNIGQLQHLETPIEFSINTYKKQPVT